MTPVFGLVHYCALSYTAIFTDVLLHTQQVFFYIYSCISIHTLTLGMGCTICDVIPLMSCILPVLNKTGLILNLQLYD